MQPNANDNVNSTLQSYEHYLSLSANNTILILITKLDCRSPQRARPAGDDIRATPVHPSVYSVFRKLILCDVGFYHDRLACC